MSRDRYNNLYNASNWPKRIKNGTMLGYLKRDNIKRVTVDVQNRIKDTGKEDITDKDGVRLIYHRT